MKVKLTYLLQNLPSQKLREFRNWMAPPDTSKLNRLINRLNVHLSPLPLPKKSSLDRKDDHEIKELLINFLVGQEISNDENIKNLWLQHALKSNIAEHELSKLDVITPSKLSAQFSSEKYLFQYLYQRTFSDKANFPFNDEKDAKEQIQILISQREQLFECYKIETTRIEISLRTIEINNRKAKPKKGNSSDLDDVRNDLLYLYEVTLYTLNKLENIHAELNQSLTLIRQLQPLDRSDFLFIYEALLSCVIFHFNSGKREYDSINFQLRRMALSYGIFEKQITAPTYRNIIFLAPLVGESLWALKFLEEYKDRLPHGEKDSSYSFSKARLFMNMERYGDVIEVLRNVEYKSLSFNLNSKLMLMAAFYELDEYEPLLSTIQAFKVFLRRRRNIRVARKKNFTDYCDALYNLIKAEDKKDKKRLEKATLIMDANPSIPSLSWLREKYADVEKMIK